MLISITRSYCLECAATHPARYEDSNGRVVYTVECPKDSKQTVVSSDSQLFTDLRGDQHFPQEASRPGQPNTHSYALPITDRCNSECPICYAESSSDGESHLSLEQLRRLATKIRENGGRRLSLAGGEPTLHPDLPEMIRMLRNDVGIAPVLITNGLRIAEDHDYLLSLKEAGLRRIKL
ncbi:MAG: radical SAM protein, partial [Planctomycetota bacterium]